MPEVLLFDLDRTLYTNKDLTDFQERILYQFVAEKLCLPFKDGKVEFDKQHEAFSKQRGIEVSKSGIVSLFYSSMVEWNLYREKYITPEGYIGRDEQLVDTFDRLKRENHRLAIASNSLEQFIKRTVELLGIQAEIIGCDTVYAAKPSIDFFISATHFLKVDPKCCISIGDRDSDIYPANTIGIRGIKLRGSNDVYSIDQHIYALNSSDKQNLIL